MRLPLGLLRLEVAVAERKGTAVAVLAAVAVVATVAGLYVFATPGTETVTETTDVREIATDVDHAAVVATNGSPWPRGERLENHPVYLSGASPTLNVTVSTNVTGGTFSSLTQDLYLVTEAEFEGETFWTEERVVDFTVASGETRSDRLHATVNVTRLRSRLGRRAAELDGVGELRTRLKLDVAYETGSYEGEYSTSAPLSITGSYYRIEGAMGETVRRGTTRQRERQRSRDVPLTAGLVVLGLLAGGAAHRLREREFSVFERDRLRRQLHRRRHAEWISRGTAPDDDAFERTVPTESLEDLVDVAIDSDRRVIYDGNAGRYAVVDGDTVYVFDESGGA